MIWKELKQYIGQYQNKPQVVASNYSHLINPYVFSSLFYSSILIMPEFKNAHTDNWHIITIILYLKRRGTVCGHFTTLNQHYLWANWVKIMQHPDCTFEIYKRFGSQARKENGTAVSIGRPFSYDECEDLIDTWNYSVDSFSYPFISVHDRDLEEDPTGNSYYGANPLLAPDIIDTLTRLDIFDHRHVLSNPALSSKELIKSYNENIWEEANIGDIMEKIIILMIREEKSKQDIEQFINENHIPSIAKFYKSRIDYYIAKIDNIRAMISSDDRFNVYHYMRNMNIHGARYFPFNLDLDRYISGVKHIGMQDIPYFPDAYCIDCVLKQNEVYLDINWQSNRIYMKEGTIYDTVYVNQLGNIDIGLSGKFIKRASRIISLRYRSGLIYLDPEAINHNEDCYCRCKCVCICSCIPQCECYSGHREVCDHYFDGTSKCKCDECGEYHKITNEEYRSDESVSEYEEAEEAEEADNGSEESNDKP